MKRALLLLVVLTACTDANSYNRKAKAACEAQGAAWRYASQDTHNWNCFRVDSIIPSDLLRPVSPTVAQRLDSIQRQGQKP